MQKILFVIIGLVSLAGVGLGIYASANPEGAFKYIEQIGEEQLFTMLPIVIFSFVLLVTLTAFSPFISNALRNSKLKKELKIKGMRKDAKIISVQDTGITINDNPHVRITVETNPGIYASFGMTASRIAVPRPGDMIQILYDPANPSLAIPAE